MQKSVKLTSGRDIPLLHQRQTTRPQQEELWFI